MSIEEIIARLEEMADDREDKILPGCLGWDEIEPLREAIALLKTHPDNQPNEPLTLEELRGMAGQPVWIKKGLEISEWAIVLGREDLFCLHFAVLRGQMRLAPKEYGTVWFAYRRPPKEVTP